MYYFDGQTARLMPNARQIKGFLANVDLSTCKGAENRDRLYFTARENGSTVDNVMVVYDIPNKTYMIRRGFTVADICSGSGTLYMINENGYVYRMEEGNTYDGIPIEAYWQTPLTDLNGKYENKQLVNMFMRGEGDAPILLECRAGKTINTHRVLLPKNEYDVAELPLKNLGRTVSFCLKNEQGGRWTIKGGIQVEFSVTGG